MKIKTPPSCIVMTLEGLAMGGGGEFSGWECDNTIIIGL